MGTVIDSYGNGLQQTVNGPYETEQIYTTRIRESAKAVEMATIDWLHRRNTTPPPVHRLQKTAPGQDRVLLQTCSNQRGIETEQKLGNFTMFGN